MLETLFTTSVAESVTIEGTVAVLISSLILGLIISLVYMKTNKKDTYSQSYILTLIMVPAIISMIILLVGSNIARAFSLAGAFSLIRYRSAPGDSKDIAYVFFTLGVGLACGMGYIAYGALFTVLLCLAMIVLSYTKFGIRKNPPMRLKITVPEDTNYQGLFDETLEQFASDYKLMKIKTTDFGSLFELVYDVHLNETTDTKEFIDQLRSKNGNLNVALMVKESKGDIL